MSVSGGAEVDDLESINRQLATVGWESTGKNSDHRQLWVECHVVCGKELLGSEKLLKAWDDVFSDSEENEAEAPSKYEQLWFMFLATTGEYTLAIIATKESEESKYRLCGLAELRNSSASLISGPRQRAVLW